MEIWKNIDGFDGVYQVSSYGNVRNISKLENKKNTVNNRGYVPIHLYKEGKCYPRLMHRLVAEAFIENPKNKSCVNHINGNKTDNRIDNLEWVTYQENANHAWKNKLYSKEIDRPWVRGSKSGMSKLDENKAIEIYNLCYTSKHTHSQIGEMFGVSKSVVTQIKNKKAWIHIHK